MSRSRVLCAFWASSALATCLAAGLVGCLAGWNDDRAGGGPDAVDVGASAPDVGGPRADAGAGPHDSEPPPPDTGSTPTDVAGPRRDQGPPPADASGPGPDLAVADVGPGGPDLSAHDLGTGDAGRIACAPLEPTPCLEAPLCVLYQEPLGRQYRCRELEHPCERHGGEQLCVAEAGCAWSPGYCYCPPEIDCDCGDGPPPVCGPEPPPLCERAGAVCVDAGEACPPAYEGAWPGLGCAGEPQGPLGPDRSCCVPGPQASRCLRSGGVCVDDAAACLVGAGQQVALDCEGAQVCCMSPERWEHLPQCAAQGGICVADADECARAGLDLGSASTGCLRADGAPGSCCQPRLQVSLGLHGPDHRLLEEMRPGEALTARLRVHNSSHLPATVAALKRSCHQGAGHLVIVERPGHGAYVNCMDGACMDGRFLWAGVVPPMSGVIIDEVEIAASGDACNPALAPGTYTLQSDLWLLTPYDVESPSATFTVLP